MYIYPTFSNFMGLRKWIQA